MATTKLWGCVFALILLAVHTTAMVALPVRQDSQGLGSTDRQLRSSPISGLLPHHRVVRQDDGGETTTAAPSEETTTEESYDEGGDGGGDDIGSQILNFLMGIANTIMSLFGGETPESIKRCLDQAKSLMGGARALMGRVREARMMGEDIPEIIPQLVNAAKSLMDVALKLPEMGPEGEQTARGMLEEANRILLSAHRMMGPSRTIAGRISNTARRIGDSITRPWRQG